MKITYTGPHDEVEAPAFGIFAKRGEAVDVPADAVGALCVGDWEPADADAKREWKKAAEHPDGAPEPEPGEVVDEENGQ